MVKTREQQLYELGRKFALLLLEDFAKSTGSVTLAEILYKRRTGFPLKRSRRTKKATLSKKELNT